jgi:glyoxylase-like metal-dependent hydrolase (beta-lactamase superfamily II)
VFEVLHCPGHTPGHVVFINHALKFAQLGDVLFQGSVGRTDFPYGDHAALIDAIKTKLMKLGDDYSVHLRPRPQFSTIGAERRTIPSSSRRRRRILSANLPLPSQVLNQLDPLQPIRGTRDILGEEQRRHSHVIATARAHRWAVRLR